MTHSIRQTSWRAFFLRSTLPLGDFQRFLAALETLRPLRTFGSLCPGEAAGTVSRSTEAVIAATAAFFYSLDLRLSRERGRASARQIKLLSIFSLEYIYLLYSLFLMLLLVACWTSVGCLLFGVLDGCSGVLLMCIFIGTYECFFECWLFVYFCRDFYSRFTLIFDCKVTTKTPVSDTRKGL